MNTEEHAFPNKKQEVNLLADVRGRGGGVCLRPDVQDADGEDAVAAWVIRV